MRIIKELIDAWRNPSPNNQDLAELISASIEENHKLVTKILSDRQILVTALVNIRNGILPNGDHVDGTVSLYAEDILKEII